VQNLYIAKGIFPLIGHYSLPFVPHFLASMYAFKTFIASKEPLNLIGVKEVPESQRSDAANSLVYEANARIRDPVYGCMGVISTLQHQIQSLQAELHAVRGELVRYRSCTQDHTPPPAPPLAIPRYPAASTINMALSSTAESADFAAVSPSTS
ncbi:hypothetical protein KI387_037094, partial [Taxus chinensis]